MKKLVILALFLVPLYSFADERENYFPKLGIIAESLSLEGDTLIAMIKTIPSERIEVGANNVADGTTLFIEKVVTSESIIWRVHYCHIGDTMRFTYEVSREGYPFDMLAVMDSTENGFRIEFWFTAGPKWGNIDDFPQERSEFMGKIGILSETLAIEDEWIHITWRVSQNPAAYDVSGSLAGKPAGKYSHIAGFANGERSLIIFLGDPTDTLQYHMVSPTKEYEMWGELKIVDGEVVITRTVQVKSWVDGRILRSKECDF